MYHILLYYKIQPIQHPKSEIKTHKEVCKALGLKGRILLSDGGINGTMAGSKAGIDMYRAYMDAHRLFDHIDFKESTSEKEPFPVLQIRYRDEIVTTGVKEKCDLTKRGKHLDRDTFHEWLVSKKDMVLLDMRNDYEWEIGRFKGAIKPPMKYFRDLDSCMDFYERFKGKTIVMFCTGGIRCESASSLFLTYGFDKENVYQLDGGIVKYAEKYGNDGFYEGKCFVFDERMAVPVNTSDAAEIIGLCLHCRAPNDVYRNCGNKYCNKLFLSCDACTDTWMNTCSSLCKETIEKPVNRRVPHANDKGMHRNK